MSHGGLTLAKYLRKRDKNIEIIIVEKQEYISYSQCAMPYYISGEVSEEDIVFNSAQDLKDKYDLEIYLKTEVIEIYSDKNQIQVSETSKGTMFNISYDYLVLSVGSIAKKLKEFENLGDNIFIHKNLRNAKRLKRFIERNEPRNALIVGSGAISLELSENLNKIGIDVYILEKEDVLIPRFDKDISMEIENIASEFVTVIKQGKILKVKEDTELYRGRNRDVLEVEYSIRK